jgi:hypothetical protein
MRKFMRELTGDIIRFSQHLKRALVFGKIRSETVRSKASGVNTNTIGQHYRSTLSDQRANYSLKGGGFEWGGDVFVASSGEGLFPK